MVASNKFPKLVGATKLNLLLDLIPNPNDWTSEALIAKRASGISAETINGIVNSLDDYFEWYNENIRPIIGNKRLIPTNQEAPEERENQELQEERERHPAQPAYGGGPRITIALTGFRDKSLEDKFIVKDSVPKQSSILCTGGNLWKARRLQRQESITFLSSNLISCLQCKCITYTK